MERNNVPLKKIPRFKMETPGGFCQQEGFTIKPFTYLNKYRKIFFQPTILKHVYFDFNKYSANYYRISLQNLPLCIVPGEEHSDVSGKWRDTVP